MMLGWIFFFIALGGFVVGYAIGYHVSLKERSGDEPIGK